MKLLEQAWLDNDLQAFGIALAVAAGVLLAILIARYVGARILTSLSRRTTMIADDIAASAVRATKLWLLAPLALRVGASVLELDPALTRVLTVVAMIGVVLQAGVWGAHVAAEWIQLRSRQKEKVDGAALMALSLLGFAARVVIWALVLLVVLDQLGFNITALVAGLGIGGVAIALALQNILGDLFASMSIVLDKPFVVGDFIAVDDLRGTVQYVGIKTTRVRSLDGEMLVFSNSDLLKSRIRNFQKLIERRVLFGVGVTYQTDLAQVRAIPAMLREAIEGQARTRFDRAHFKEYGDSALAFEAVYYVLDRDYNFFMDTQQAINLALFERFAAQGIEFAYPTRTVHIAASAVEAE